MSGEDDGFLSRWSRRKRGGEAEEPEVAQPVAKVIEETEEDTVPADPQGPEEEAAVLEQLGLPDPDTLEQGADFSVFMAKSVPEVIRKRALRRLWRSNPTLAVLDGLNDYDDDFAGGFVKPGTLKTAYEVGKGIVRQVAEADPEDGAEEAPALPQSASSVRPPEPEAKDTALVATDHADEAPETGENTEEEGPDDAAEDEAEETPRPARRRMAFRFEGNGSG